MALHSQCKCMFCLSVYTLPSNLAVYHISPNASASGLSFFLLETSRTVNSKEANSRKDCMYILNIT